MAETITPRTIHRIGGVALILAALVMAGQGLAIMTLSDTVLLDVIKKVSRVQRDAHKFGPMERPMTDAELDAKIDESRAQVLQDARAAKGGLMSNWIVKFVAAGALLAIALGAFTGRPSPTRVLAVLIGLLMLLGSFGAFASYSENAKFQSCCPAWWGWIDFASLLFFPIATLFCLIFVMGSTWRETDSAPA